jgi:hypothetical protein
MCAGDVIGAYSRWGNQYGRDAAIRSIHADNN